ncbi:unnamed protein product [Orchesella dallaii]|uniref:Uncharacterized protein n=1 Tax=Orchesella dallaii TaxID=48710 RepID=A0ABP1Q3Q9_9HEXA
MDKVKMKKEQKTKVEMEKHYPWLQEFDVASRTVLANPEEGITNRHVIKLLTFLESKISPEVSKLITKPNRATNFLGQIRKRIGLTKVSGWLTDVDAEKELLPTFGLLMIHFVNITLVSSKMQKMSVQTVASDLYYMLKLMLQVDTEYVLDVVLCSNLSEHASTDDDVGFQVYSNIVGDWRYYLDSKSSESSKMKYCYVASLLSESTEGQRIIERDLPSYASKEFVVYLNNTLGMKLKLTKNYLYANIVQQIKTKRVIIAMSRRRLIIVSERDVSKTRVAEHEDNSDADSHSSNSTVNIITSSNKNKQRHPDSSQDDQPEDLGFRLDTTGSYNNDQANWRSNEYDSLVSSSTNKRRRTSDSSTDTLSIDRNVKIDEDNAMVEQIDEGNNPRARSGKSGHRLRTTTATSSSSIEEVEIPSRFQSMDLDADRLDARSPDRNENEDELDDITSEFQHRELIGKELREALGAEIDSDPDHGHDENDQDEEEGYEKTEDEDYIGRSRKHSSTKLVVSDDDEEDDENDSDLEVLEIVEDNAMISSPERDEAEAESGEDVVPNYDDDSDEDRMGLDVASLNNSKETTIVPPSPKASTSSTLEDNDNSSEEEDKEEAKDLKDTAVENGKDESDVAMESDGVEDEVEDRTSDNGDNENFRIIAPTSPKGSEDSSSTSNSPDGSNVTTSSSVKSCQSPDITQQSPVRTRHRKVSISSDEDDDSQAVGVSVRSSSASPARKVKLNNDLDKEESQSQPVSTPSQSQPAQSKTRGRTPRGGKATPATADLGTRRVTRACTATIRESSEETNTGSISLRSRGASTPTKTRGRGRGRGSTLRK